eukprot:CAMPEP_0177754102 /NCGR_PEP_ID=MMETSP0491_2-20121128/1826_1 /TAXON_ID=63592 /ORGANISM="Tetraselmis chuii, Strain PLY429" /LENGTH=40 /DNA_ID= /DNA_START= /DNA_END= /DNA_ORIENTATION=
MTGVSRAMVSVFGSHGLSPPTSAFTSGASQLLDGAALLFG